MTSVVITGRALEHLKAHAGYIKELLKDPNVTNNSDRIRFTEGVLPNGKHDVLFLQAWVDGEILGDGDIKTEMLSFRSPFKTEKVERLLDFLQYATPKTQSSTFLHKSGRMLNSVVITGRALEHLKHYSGRVQEWMKDSKQSSRVKVTSDTVPSGKLDIEFLQDWVDGVIVGDADVETGELAFRPPYNETQVHALLDYLQYTTPQKREMTFLHESGIMADSVVLTGRALAHLKTYSERVREWATSAEDSDRIKVASDSLPNGTHDILFLKAWENREVLGEMDRTTGMLTVVAPFKVDRVKELLKYLQYATPATRTKTFLRSGIIKPPGTLTLGHGHGRPVATPAVAQPVEYANYSEFAQEEDDYDEEEPVDEKPHKRGRHYNAYRNVNANEHGAAKPFAKRGVTKKEKRNRSAKNEKRTKVKHRQTYKLSSR